MAKIQRNHLGEFIKMMTITPPKNLLKLHQHVSYRRAWLDYCLENFSQEMTGVVIDLGGKRTNKRGSFHPPETGTSIWTYINLDQTTSPNIVGDVTAVPLKSECADTILCTEVLEHLANPGNCAKEIYRLLKPHGKAFISVPFMYPIHADPYDYQRFTADGLLMFFPGFSLIEIIPMGSFWGTMGMLLEIGIAGIYGKEIYKKILRKTLTLLASLLYSVELNWSLRNNNPIWQKFTTGYFIKAIK